MVVFSVLVRGAGIVSFKQFDKISKVVIAYQFSDILNRQVAPFQKTSGMLKPDFLNNRCYRCIIFMEQFAQIRLTDMKIIGNFNGRCHGIVIADIRVDLIIANQLDGVRWRNSNPVKVETFHESKKQTGRIIKNILAERIFQTIFFMHFCQQSVQSPGAGNRKVQIIPVMILMKNTGKEQ